MKNSYWTLLEILVGHFDILLHVKFKKIIKTYDKLTLYSFWLILDSDLSLGKISQLPRHTTTIQVNDATQSSFDGQSEAQNRDLNEGTIQSKMLNEMQHHLNQMEQELAIVSEESKDLQQRLIDRQQDLEKKV